MPPSLPAFPDKHTYSTTAAFAGNPRDARQQRMDASKARRQARPSHAAACCLSLDSSSLRGCGGSAAIAR